MLGWFSAEAESASRSRRFTGALGVVVFGGDDLDGDGALQAGIAGAVDLSHAARAKRGQDFVVAEAVPGDTRIGRSDYTSLTLVNFHLNCQLPTANAQLPGNVR